MFGFGKTPYKVMNNRGGILGGYKTKGAADRAAERFTKEYKADRLNRDMYAFVVECK